MDIEKALSHFKWKLKEKWKPTETDIKAYNAIVKYKQQQEKETLKNNEALAKLWIHQLMLLNSTQMYSAERSIQVIDDILALEVSEWCVKLHSKLSQMRLNSFLVDKYSLVDNNALATGKLIIENAEIVEKYQEDIEEILKKDIDYDNVVRFVEKHIARIM